MEEVSVKKEEKDGPLKKWKEWKVHDYGVTGCCFSPEKHRIATVSKDKTLKIWNISTQECIKIIPHNSDVHQYKIIFNPLLLSFFCV